MMASMVANGNRDGQSLVLKGVDPETCMIVFKNHWAQVRHQHQIYKVTWFSSFQKYASKANEKASTDKAASSLVFNPFSEE